METLTIEQQVQIIKQANEAENLEMQAPAIHAKLIEERREYLIKEEISKISTDSSPKKQADLLLAAIKKAREDIK